MKKIITLLIMSFSMLFSYAEIITIGDFDYELQGPTAAIFRYRGSDAFPIIPEKITYEGQTYPVTKIKESHYDTNSGLKESAIKSICLPKTLTTIESDYNRAVYGAFFNSTINFLVLPSSLKKFVYCPFQNCSRLQYLYFTSTQAPAMYDNSNIWYTYNHPIIYVPDLMAYDSFINNPLISKDVKPMITFKNTVSTYGDNHPPYSNYVNNVENYNVSFSSIPAFKNETGNWCDTVIANFTTDDSRANFEVKIPVHYTIKPKQLTARVVNTSRKYGEKNPTFHVEYTGFVNGEDASVLSQPITISCEATPTSPAGTYPITLSGGQADNYEIVYEPGTLTVTKASLTARIENAEREYGTSNPDFRITFSGLKNGETNPAWETAPSLSTPATLTSAVGDYAITASKAVAKNYDLTAISPGRLTITPAPLTIAANNVSRLYGEQNPALGYHVSGFRNNETEAVFTTQPQLRTAASQESKAGEYAIEIGGAAAPNYRISYENGTLSILKRNLLVSTPDYTRKYGEENPDFKLSYQGFINNEDENTLTQRPKASTLATPLTDTGRYPINIQGGEADNYDFIYQGGTLTIEKAEQTLTWEQDLTNLNIGDQVELTATASSGLPVEYTLNDENFISLYTAGPRTLLDCLGSGETYIRAVQNGNQNYYPSARLSKRIQITSTVGIENTKAHDIHIKTKKGSIHITGIPQNEIIRIFAADGKQIYTGTDHSISLDPGLYIVWIKDSFTKITIR
jgi:hypothetical protein